ncbi:hypothetical protein Tco_0332426 [Tanacetum coccineum]
MIASESSATIMVENVYIQDLIDFNVTMSTSRGKFVTKKCSDIDLMKSSAYGEADQKLHQKGVYEESFSRLAAWTGGKLIQFMHTTMVPVQVKTMKIQAGVQVSRQGELRRHLQLWTCFQNLLKIGISKLEYKFQDKENSEDIFSFGSALEDFISVVFVPDRNIISNSLWEAVMSMKGFDATEIIRILEGQLITFAAMADGSCFFDC